MTDPLDYCKECGVCGQMAERIKSIERTMDDREKANKRALDTADKTITEKLVMMADVAGKLSQGMDTFFNKVDTQLKILSSFQSERKGSRELTHYIVTVVVAALVSLILHFLTRGG